MYPDMLCVELLNETAEEYGGGGPEYVVGGLLMLLFAIECKLGIEYRFCSALSRRYFSKSKLLIDGRASLLGIISSAGS